jgi:hypothetical protein
MPVGNIMAWVIARYKSVPAIVARTLTAVLLGWFDQASDMYTMASLFELGHLGAAYALLSMVCMNLAVQVGWMR